MKKSMLASSYLYAVGAFMVFIVGSLIIQEIVSVLFVGVVVLLFTGTAIVLMKKLEFLEKQSRINQERFAVSLEHVSNVLFDNVLEADMTNDCLIGGNAEKLTALLQIPTGSSYSQTINAIAKKLVHEKYAEEYRGTLSVENVLKILQQGSNTLEYECVERSDGENYRWIRGTLLHLSIESYGLCKGYLLCQEY